MTEQQVVEAALAGDGDAVARADGVNALVLDESDGHDRAACARLVSADAPVNLLGVAIGTGPSYYHTLAAERMEHSPARLGIVDVGPGGRGDVPGARVESVADPADLTGIGIGVTSFLKAWRDDDVPTVVCFDSLTPLLQYVAVERCYRFLDVTTGRISRVCAVSHAHLDPTAHDEQNVHALRGLFDATVEVDADGWTVRRG